MGRELKQISGFANFCTRKYIRNICGEIFALTRTRGQPWQRLHPERWGYHQCTQTRLATDFLDTVSQSTEVKLSAAEEVTFNQRLLAAVQPLEDLVFNFYHYVSLDNNLTRQDLRLMLTAVSRALDVPHSAR